MLPPSTSLSSSVCRACSTRRSALAMQRRASLEASGSSLNEIDSVRSVERFDGDAMDSEPEGFLPRVFTASSACAASRKTVRLGCRQTVYYNTPLDDNGPFELLLAVLRSLRRALISSVLDAESMVEGEAK